ncbi:WXG100 family type VII secretion target [Nocardia sp. ET3-3]|uniref:ESAT-6-like protein n=1 Tax=Nocardia terrae TaxID=2675851 RepID=A0A7K1V328_9NOCA|nr:WXG100 family type VII secretion target [Nocardia terrae]MVU81040.1 WXG100 family type VII secretion target [Nocardia terrae]
MADGDDRYRVDLDLLDEAITAMTQFGTDAETMLSEIDTHINDLHMSWDSEAAKAQQLAHQKWLDGAQEIRDNLDDLRRIAQRAHTNYSSTVETNTRMWP